MHHIDIYLDNCQILTKNQNSLGIGHKKLGISVEKGRGRIKKGENTQKLKSQNVDRADQAIDESGSIDRFVGILGFKESHALHFLHCSPLFLQGFSNLGF